MDAFEQTLALRVRDGRRARGMTQADLAALAGVGRRFLSELENGKPTLRLDAVRAVLRVFGLTLTLGPLEREAEAEAETESQT